MAGPPTAALTPELIATLWSYLPRLVVRRRIQDPRPLEGADRHAFAGAALLADVSGFTRLSAQLAARGPAGIEALTGLLNACFGQLISRIQADGGDIVKFAGDALLAVWPVAGASWTGPLPPADLSAEALNESLTEALQRAAGCALALVDADLPAGPETGGLRLRVAVSAGEVEVLHLGGIFGRWEVVVTGEPLADLAPALQAVQPGQAAVAARAWPRLAGSATGAGSPTSRFAFGKCTPSRRDRCRPRIP